MDDLRATIIIFDGVLSLAQALACGLSPSAVDRLVRSGEWIRIARGVFLVSGHLRSDRAQARIAVLSVGAQAVLGGAAAAWWLGIHPARPRRHLVFTGARGQHRRASSTTVVAHRNLQSADVVVHNGLRVTAAALTVLDAAVALGIEVIDRALLMRRVTVEELRDAHARYPKRHGSGTVAGFLELIADGTRSVAERVLTGLLDDADITGWVAGLRWRAFEIDLAFPELKLAIEVDGFAFHRDVTTFQYDRTRRNALVADGWVVLNFTWADLIERPDDVIAQIRSALARLAA